MTQSALYQLTEFESAWVHKRTQALIETDIAYAAARMIALNELAQRRRRQQSHRTC